ncbi:MULTISPECIES: PQQ-dependent sugar dehydrogenase [Cyanophyceae]|uniref:PQQ-dependent sugar dehydrogenase n=1 Tax=Cyanophyceae TaxID=3028117 RepID=UPI001684A995|nr:MULTISPECIES: PQQ-dependent sugar dehydrogenase [Cyanophyceae]MBD1914332.1 PQQ-dependent sugar dehydrogenase [Phormidium sp. FACHB-77]MBD2028684.1 PQQ-dependent sugar dehydrogenase [Phormidium sp. FACHB-322]MBD2053622.1 PQQ-dependent sugar dehydrogenase [Leptolyngbya sp. FACHB-60]
MVFTRFTAIFAPCLVLLALGSCASAPNPTAQAPTDTAQVEPSQAPAQPTSEPVVSRVEPVTVVEGLEHPWSMVWLPDGDMLITERPGRLRRVSNGALDPTPIAGVPEVLAFRQGGLLDIALHPEFENNGLIYLAYADGTQQANRTQVARARLEGNTLSDWTVIFTNNRDKSDGQHFGSRLLWLPDGTLLVALGDGGNPPLQLNGELIRNQAQNRQTLLGSVVRLTEEGEAPSDNPFVNDAGANPLVWSYGHRNIQGLALDPKTSRVWSTEHGSRGGDELNRLEPGENYGWPVVTYSDEYSGGPVSTERSRPDMVDPLTYWTPSIAPSGLAVYRGDRYPQWQGQLFAGGLVSQDVRRIEVDANGAVVDQVSIPIGQRVRDVRQGPDGFLYVLTDDPNGRLVRLEPAS